jgi:hypothetical protein
MGELEVALGKVMASVNTAVSVRERVRRGEWERYVEFRVSGSFVGVWTTRACLEGRQEKGRGGGTARCIKTFHREEKGLTCSTRDERIFGITRQVHAGGRSSKPAIADDGIIVLPSVGRSLKKA